MPQISPISWVLVIMVFCLSFTAVKAHLTPFNVQTMSKETIKMNSKKFSW